MHNKTKFLFLAIPLLVLSFSCTKEENGPRSEYIEVYRSLPGSDSPSATPLKEFCVDVRENTTTLYVKTNTEVAPSWQDASVTPWAKVVSYKASSVEGVYELELKVSRISSNVYYTRRSGTLILSNSNIDFAKFLTVHQGAVGRYSCDMAALDYGDGNPLSENGEIYRNWSATVKKSCTFTSTSFGGSNEAYLYGLKGYVRLGDGLGHGADLITPYVSSLRADSLVMASFNAVAYVSSQGVKDDNKFKVEVLGGGVIADYADEGRTEIEFNAGYLEPSSSKFPSDMWKGASWLVFIKGTASNPITADTRIRIVAGDLQTESQTPTRLFVDNVYLRRLVPGVDEDYYSENKGSGPDTILGR